MSPDVVNALHQIYAVAALALASGFVTAGLTQLLKFPWIKWPAEKYPVPTAAGISVILSALAVWTMHAVVLDGILAWLILSGATLFVAAQSYDLVKKAIDQLKQNQ
jgi:hypothetical protein